MKKLLEFLSHPLVVIIILAILIAVGGWFINQINPEYLKDEKNFKEFISALIAVPLFGGFIAWMFK